MFSSKLIHFIRSRLTVKLVLIFVLFFSTVSILLSSFFIIYQKALLDNELWERLHSLARNLAYNCSINLDSNKKSVVNSLVIGVKREPYIENVFLTDMEGKILASSDTLQTGGKCPIPSGIDSTSGKKWFQVDNPSLRRTITPVEIDVQIVDAKHTLIAPSKGKPPFPDNTLQLVNLLFPSFSPGGDAVTFSAFVKSVSSTSSITNTLTTMSVSIRDHNLRLLVNDGTNAFWSRDGRFLVYCGLGKTAGIYVVNIETGAVKKIVKVETEMVSVPCFTPDDRYVIATLLTKEGNERLFSIPREGGTPVQITFHEGDHWWPTCSSDGRWVLYGYVSKRKLYAYNTQTQKSKLVFPGLKDEQWGGSFSPDGTQICYLRKLDELRGWEVFIADSPFSGRSNKSDDPYGRQLTFSGGLKWFNADWSPDGKWITFAEKGLDENYDIWIVPSQGGEPINLTGSLQSQQKKIGYVILDVSMDNLKLAVDKGKRIAFLISFLFIGLGSLGALILVRNVVRPVKHLEEASGEIARGDFSQRVLTSRSDEIGRLTESFNRMTEQLQVSREEIEAGTRELAKKHYELERAYKELDTLDKAKDNFISLVSHEIRTPLSSILTYSEMLRDGLVKSDEKIHRYQDTVVQECKRLTRLINDVLDLSKMEAGRMAFTLEPLNIRELVQETYNRFQPVLDNYGLQFIQEHGPEDMYLLGDRDKLIQVLINIISNAIKYTPKGGTITVSWKSDDRTGIVAVADTGKGIAEEDIPKVFDRFTQLENIEHHSEGTGLGMAISKSIIERLGGKIWIESTLGQGATVLFTLPLAKTVPESKNLSSVEDTRENQRGLQRIAENGSLKVLIVDDDEPLRVALSEIVRSAGYETFVASDGQEALDMVRYHHPALIILDVMLPGISGLEVCRNIRQDPEAGRTKIIMLSARGQDKEKEEGIQAGADRYITKPFSYEELGPVIKELIGDNT
jgi:signal transduction histidine kinase/CheY-like chemotaxis protein